MLRRERVRAAVSALPEPARLVVELRFGLGREGPANLEEITRRLSISRERVRELEISALADLSRALEGVDEFEGLLKDVRQPEAAAASRTSREPRCTFVGSLCERGAAAVREPHGPPAGGG